MTQLHPILLEIGSFWWAQPRWESGNCVTPPFQSGNGSYIVVEVHANIIDNLLHNDERTRSFLTRGVGEDLIDIGFILLFGLVFGGKN